MTKQAYDSAGNDAYLRRKHAELEARVEALSTRRSLTPEEVSELGRLKKTKLALKDGLNGI